MQATTVRTTMTQEQHAASVRRICDDFMFATLHPRIQDAILDYCAGLMPMSLVNTNETLRSFVIANYGPLHDAAKQHAREQQEIDLIPAYGTVMF